jgi:DNA primase
MRFDEGFLERVRAATDIVEILSPYVKLKKKGQNWFGLCPFHNEKTGSFSVNRERGLYYCFGCGAGGNVVTFLMEHDGMHFAQAVEELASQAGLPLPKQAPDPDRDRREELKEALDAAASFYQQQLKGPAGTEAVAYLKSRGITGTTAKTYRLGYAPGGWENLLTHLKDKGYREPLLAEAGLIKRREGGGFYDTFRSRLVFPFMDRRGRVVGFGARLLKDDAEGPKYLNSPETPLYQKGRVLYGLPQAAESLNREERALLVEGYFDVLSLHQADIPSAVAASGTAFTPQQGQILKRLVKRVLLIFDADPAGAKAAFRSYAGLSREGLDVMFVPMPGGEDPDTMIRSEGPEAFRSRLRHAESIVPFFIGTCSPPLEERDVGDRAETARSLLELLKEDSDPLRRALNLEQAATGFGIDQRALEKELDQLERITPQYASEEDRDSAPAREKPPGRLEMELLRLLITAPKESRAVLEGISTDDLEDPQARSLFQQIAAQLSEPENGLDLDQLLERTEPAVRNLLASIMSEEAPDDPVDPTRTVEELLHAMESRRGKNRRRRLKSSIEQARLAGDEAALARLLKEYQEMPR